MTVLGSSQRIKNSYRPFCLKHDGRIDPLKYSELAFEDLLLVQEVNNNNLVKLVADFELALALVLPLVLLLRHFSFLSSFCSFWLWQPGNRKKSKMRDQCHCQILTFKMSTLAF